MSHHTQHWTTSFFKAVSMWFSSSNPPTSTPPLPLSFARSSKWLVNEWMWVSNEWVQHAITQPNDSYFLISALLYLGELSLQRVPQKGFSQLPGHLSLASETEKCTFTAGLKECVHTHTHTHTHTYTYTITHPQGRDLTWQSKKKYSRFCPVSSLHLAEGNLIICIPNFKSES
jgi:hypothetical protein